MCSLHRIRTFLVALPLSCGRLLLPQIRIESYNAVLSSYTHNGELQRALSLLKVMKEKGVSLVRPHRTIKSIDLSTPQCLGSTSQCLYVLRNVTSTCRNWYEQKCFVLCCNCGDKFPPMRIQCRVILAALVLARLTKTYTRALTGERLLAPLPRPTRVLLNLLATA